MGFLELLFVKNQKIFLIYLHPIVRLSITNKRSIYFNNIDESKKCVQGKDHMLVVVLS